MEIKQDCRFFLSDRPCSFHKKDGVSCHTCQHYQPYSGSLLIIKREALGDVLRTTALLEPLRQRYPYFRFIWLTAAESQKLLENNPLIDEVWTDASAFYLTAVSFLQFDLIINLDLSVESLLLAAIAPARKRVGFWLDRSGKIIFSNSAARQWFALSHNDQAKKSGRVSYQRWMAQIMELETIGRIIVPISNASANKAMAFALTNRLAGKKVIGINPGSGTRWLTKRWPEENWRKLIECLQGNRILLLGGKEEENTLNRLAARYPEIVLNTGADNSLSDFFALVNLCDVVVTGDTLTLHIATGLNKKVVALFGPTSAAEIEDYGLVKKIVTPWLCQCCYRRECPDYPACMAAIDPVEVSQLVLRLLRE
ncbi:MAG: glycosyltransferase family 9 protein [Candidatus Omnitrophica bacterium]|nr:glycosyltransferase family 9 protein [Candidatus Omnitrophota bacterium]